MKKLFNDFPPISAKQWKQKIQYELNGDDYNTIVYNSAEGIKVKPFYTNEDFDPHSYVLRSKSNFNICQSIFVNDPQKSNSRAIQYLTKGVESIHFIIIDDKTDIAKLLLGIDLVKTPIYLELSFLSIDFIQKIETFATNKKAKIYCSIDPIGNLAKSGNWFSTNEKNNFDTLNNISKNTSGLSVIWIKGSLYQNAGATMTQQIAYSLAHLNEYFNRIPVVKKPIVIEIAVGGNYFFEIAKLRALRLLFKLIASEYGHHIDCHLFVVPTKRNKSVYDASLNAFRTTTECMSAMFGGADCIMNASYDGLHRKDNEKSTSIARNQLLTLKTESCLDTVGNPTDGSYYIENLTMQLAEKALDLFKEIESKGGFLKLLIDGTIKKKIEESAAKEQELFDATKDVIIGSNHFIHDKVKMSDQLELYPFVKIKARKTLIPPIIEKRLAEKIEQNRLKDESIND